MNKILMTGDCLEKLKCISDNSMDAIVTDPPYGLSFMGKKWDYDIPSVAIWRECLRVLKPGAFLLSFGGTRTQHRLVCGVEDAGFEIRDMITWNYGTGFPKSHNIGKAIDKLQGNERDPTGEIKHHAQKGVSIAEERGAVGGGAFGQSKDEKVTKGNSEWEGWGTALKPAMETICVARKPLSEKTVALNVLKWGTGGINIDECRVGNEIIQTCGGNSGDKVFGKYNKIKHQPHQGRFPANTIFDKEAGKMLDEQSGVSKSSANNFKSTDYKEHKTSTPFIRGDLIGRGDSGGASRFFYCPKSSKAERDRGCEEISIKNNHPTVKPINLIKYLIKLVSRENAIVLDPFLGSGTTGIAALELKRQFIGIERDEGYMKIAKARIRTVTK